MTENGNPFAGLDNSINIEVKLGDDEVVNVVGKGIVSVCTKQGENKSVSNIYLIQGLKNNFMSFGQLNQNGYSV
jgi:hypothetical protein